MDYFVLNGICSKDMGIRVNELPSITKASKIIIKTPILGRSEFLTKDNKTYSGTVRNVKCTLVDLSKFDAICAWLDGIGDVVFSNQKDRFYKAYITSEISFDRLSIKHSGFTIIFDCQPFGYALNTSILPLTSPGTIFNPGSTISLPVIKVYGSGALVLNINSNVIKLSNVSEYVTIDSLLIDAYKETLLKNTDMSGEFPELVPGPNVISWSGAVVKILITTQWRWL